MDENLTKNKKVILITGGSSNLGKVVTNWLAKRNTVYSGYYTSIPEKKDPGVNYIKLDVTDDNSVQSVLKRIIDKEKNLDVLINCVGISKSGKIADSSISDFDMLMNINTKGPYRVIKKVLPIMKKQKHGKIINITSMSGLVSLPNYGIYSASKFAFEAFTTALRYEVLKDNIWVTNIEPGAIKTNSEKTVKINHKTFREKYLIGRLLMPFVSPVKIAKLIEKTIESASTPPYLLVGNDVFFTDLAKRLLPNYFWDLLIRKTLT
jgi:short-subunit dehydrogenase